MLDQPYSPSTYDNLSGTEDYQPPNADDLAARLLENKKPVRDYDYINSRESTPLIEIIPLTMSQLRAKVRRGQRKLEEKYGKPAADKIRRSIPSLLYWRREVEHFTKLCNMDDEEQLDHRELIRRATSDWIRDVIKDVEYWKIEAAELAGFCVKQAQKRTVYRVTVDSLREEIDIRGYWFEEFNHYADHIDYRVMEPTPEPDEELSVPETMASLEPHQESRQKLSLAKSESMVEPEEDLSLTSLVDPKQELSSTESMQELGSISTAKSMQGLSPTSTTKSKQELNLTSTAESKQGLGLTSTQRLKGIRKRKNGPRSTPRTISKDAPVSSRLRSSRRARKESARRQS